MNHKLFLKYANPSICTLQRFMTVSPLFFHTKIWGCVRAPFAPPPEYALCILFFLFQLSDTVEAVKSALETEKELADKSQKELEDDLTKSKHRSIYISIATG